MTTTLRAQLLKLLEEKHRDLQVPPGFEASTFRLGYRDGWEDGLTMAIRFLEADCAVTASTLSAETVARLRATMLSDGM